MHLSQREMLPRNVRGPVSILSSVCHACSCKLVPPPFWISLFCPRLRSHRTSVWEGTEEMRRAEQGSVSLTPLLKVQGTGSAGRGQSDALKQERSSRCPFLSATLSIAFPRWKKYLFSPQRPLSA